MKPNRKEILENKLRTIVQKIIKEEFRNSDYFKNQLKYFHDVDFIPDSREEIELNWPEPYKTKALKAWKIRKRNFNRDSEARKKSFE